MYLQKIITAVTFIGLLHNTSKAQVPGCTDSQANNFNPSATINDGSCSYNTTSLSVTDKASLATPLLDESSGITFVGSRLWTHNDSGNSNSIYRVDTTSGAVVQTVVISNATNTDWEDITTNSTHLYIGDFGNNNGNRQNLKVYRVSLSDLTPAATTVTADVINFSFSDQTSFPSLPNNNNFDCESIILYNDSLHLFSKNWVDRQCKHYVIPNIAGTHVAQLRETFNAGMLVTGATIQRGGVIALLGYDNTGLVPVSTWMLYDFKNGLFFNGNKRKFTLGTMLTLGQTEGIEFLSEAYGYISNERFSSGITIPAKIRTFNLAPFLPASYVNPPVAAFSSDFTTVCKNKSVQFADNSTNNPVWWQWSFTGGNPASSTLKNPGVTYATPGVYPVTLVCGNYAGSGSVTITGYITVNSLPAASITPPGPQHFCTGGSVLLSANTGNGLSYAWKKGGTFIAGATSSTYSVTSAGTYRVQVTNSNGCTKLSTGSVITGPPSATITVTGSLNLCPGDSVVLSVPFIAGNSYQWKRNNANVAGAVSNEYAAYTAGNYKVTVTDVFACSKTSGTKTVTAGCRTVEPYDENPVNIYPNPSADGFVFHSHTVEIVHVKVYEPCGKLMLEFEDVKDDDFIFGEGLPRGIYFCEIISGNESRILKLVKL